MLATLGAAGAVLVTAAGAGRPRRRRSPRSTVGAGDSSLFGYLRADLGGAEPPQRLRLAVAYGSAAAALPGSALPTPAQIDLEPFGSTLDFAALSPTPPVRNNQLESIAMTSTASRPIIDADLVRLDVDAGADKHDVIGRLAGQLADAGRTADADGLAADALAREEQSATGLPGGIAIPHCRTPPSTPPTLGFARLAPAGRLRRQGRPGRPGVPDRRARSGRRRRT